MEQFSRVRHQLPRLKSTWLMQKEVKFHLKPLCRRYNSTRVSICQVTSVAGGKPRLSSLRLALRLDHATPNRIFDQISAIMQVELFHNISTMALHGFHANHQLSGNLAVGQALGNQFQNL